MLRVTVGSGQRRTVGQRVYPVTFTIRFHIADHESSKNAGSPVVTTSEMLAAGCLDAEKVALRFRPTRDLAMTNQFDDTIQLHQGGQFQDTP